MHAPQVCWQRAQKDSSEPRALVCSHSVAALARWHSGAVPRSKHVAIGWNPKRSSGQLTAALAAAAAAAAAAAVADAADMAMVLRRNVRPSAGSSHANTARCGGNPHARLYATGRFV